MHVKCRYLFFYSLCVASYFVTMHKIDIFEVPDDFFTNGKTSGSRRPVNSTSHGREHLTVCACHDVHRPHIANIAMSDLLAWTAQTAIPTFFTFMYLAIFPISSLLMMMMSRYDVRLGECLGCGLTWNGSFATKLFTFRSERWHTVFLWCLQRSDEAFSHHRNTDLSKMACRFSLLPHLLSDLILSNEHFDAIFLWMSLTFFGELFRQMTGPGHLN